MIKIYKLLNIAFVALLIIFGGCKVHPLVMKTDQELANAKVFTSIESTLVNPREVFVLRLQAIEGSLYECILPKELKLAKNNLTAIPDNQLEKLPKTIGEMDLLQTINLANNKLVELIDFSGLSNLSFINLRNNQLNTINASFFNAPQLVEINFSMNKIDQVTGEFTNVNTVKRIDLEINILNVIPIQFTYLHSLELLNLAQNKITLLTKTVNKMVQLKELNLSENNIDLFDKIVSEHPSLQKIDLSNNKVKLIPLDYAKIKHLESLDLSGNPLYSWHTNQIEKAFKSGVVVF